MKRLWLPLTLCLALAFSQGMASQPSSAAGLALQLDLSMPEGAGVVTLQESSDKAPYLLVARTSIQRLFSALHAQLLQPTQDEEGLQVQTGEMEFPAGTVTDTLGVNGDYLGPTLIRRYAHLARAANAEPLCGKSQGFHERFHFGG